MADAEDDSQLDPVAAEASVASEAPAPGTDMSVPELREWLRKWIADATGQSADGIDESAPMVELGLSSRDAVAMASDSSLTGAGGVGVSLQNTTVTVTLESSVTQVTVGGAVQKPGKYIFDRPTTVLQAIMEAGGTDQFGTLGKVSMIRLVNGKQYTQVLDLRPVLQGQPTKPVYVHSGDVVLVAESVF